MKIVVIVGLILIFLFGIGAAILTSVNFDEISK